MPKVGLSIRYRLPRRRPRSFRFTRRKKREKSDRAKSSHKRGIKKRLISPGERYKYRLPFNNNNNASRFGPRYLSNKVANNKRNCFLKTDAILYRLPNFAGSFKHSPRPSETITATFHQRTGKKGLSSEFRGFQCTSMALGAILISKLMPLQRWKTADLDAILRYGDLLHEDLLVRRPKHTDDPRIALHEIPTGDENKYNVPIPVDKTNWYTKDHPLRKRFVLSKSEELYGLVHPIKAGFVKEHTDLGYTTLEDAIAKIMREEFDGIVITVGDVSGSVLKDDNGKLRYFDSHCNNKWGRLCLDGTAVLVTFDNIADFVRLIRKREPRTHYRYELIGVKAHPVAEE